MTREELIDLVKEIKNPEDKTENELDALVDFLQKNVTDPEVTDYIYFDELTAEEIIDKALSYKPILL